MYKSLELMKLTLQEFESCNAFDLMKRLTELQEDENIDYDELDEAYQILSDALISKKKVGKTVKKKYEAVKYPEFTTHQGKLGYSAMFDRKGLAEIDSDDITPQQVTSITDKDTENIVPIILPKGRLPVNSVAIVKGNRTGKGLTYLVDLTGVGKC